ncbi:LexA family protein [Deinococcus ruber]|uniref:LexA repressor n=1 Tax=Deinococcus ruber TaxID=1848197 RepID=A0A918F9D3_9DEIO|nr:LexA family transcriptional regulator [Deinococcus ruber]GGR17952.1 lexA repressor [Deinococcus ruber]
MPPGLTPRRLELLTALHRLSMTQGSVSIADLAAELGVSRPRIQVHLDALRTLALVTRATGKHGDLGLTDEGRAAIRVGIPVYGEIAAGPPGHAEQTPGRAVRHLEELLGHRDGDYLLEVRGESMIGIGVMPGDYVLVRPTQEVLDGEVAVVLIPGEHAATLKRLYRFGDEVTLLSENPLFSRMVYPAEDVQVQGRMLGVIGLPRPRVSRLSELPRPE